MALSISFFGNLLTKTKVYVLFPTGPRPLVFELDVKATISELLPQTGEKRPTWPPALEPTPETLAIGGRLRVGFGGREHRI